MLPTANVGLTNAVRKQTENNQRAALIFQAFITTNLAVTPTVHPQMPNEDREGERKKRNLMQRHVKQNLSVNIFEWAHFMFSSLVTLQTSVMTNTQPAPAPAPRVF